MQELPAPLQSRPGCQAVDAGTPTPFPALMQSSQQGVPCIPGGWEGSLRSLLQARAGVFPCRGLQQCWNVGSDCAGLLVQTAERQSGI